MSDLAARYVSTGNLERAARIYEEMLLLGRYLPPQYTGAALNSLIATHFDRGKYEHALMHVRIGIAVLDDVGLGAYRAMDRIIGEVSRLGPVVDGFERDFDDALEVGRGRCRGPGTGLGRRRSVVGTGVFRTRRSG